VQSMGAALRGHIDGLGEDTVGAVLAVVAERSIDKVFVDGSNLGTLAKAIRRAHPRVEVITFYHNVETRFFWGALRERPSLRAGAVLLANALAEWRATRASHRRVCLSQRDSRLLARLFWRGATDIAPLAVADHWHEAQSSPSPSRNAPAPAPAAMAPYVLFVGSSFYANRAGVEWFIREVIDHVPMRLCVVGRGFDRLRASLERPGKVDVIGPVEDLAQWYAHAALVVAPIFDGSGMKTKVAEALMHGKKLIGTPEAFAGYEHIAGQAGWIARDGPGFVAAIKDAAAQNTAAFVPALRQLYLDQFSEGAARRRLKEITA